MMTMASHHRRQHRIDSSDGIAPPYIFLPASHRVSLYRHHTATGHQRLLAADGLHLASMSSTSHGVRRVAVAIGADQQGSDTNCWRRPLAAPAASSQRPPPPRSAASSSTSCCLSQLKSPCLTQEHTMEENSHGHTLHQGETSFALSPGEYHIGYILPQPSKASTLSLTQSSAYIHK